MMGMGTGQHGVRQHVRGRNKYPTRPLGNPAEWEKIVETPWPVRGFIYQALRFPPIEPDCRVSPILVNLLWEPEEFRLSHFVYFGFVKGAQNGFSRAAYQSEWEFPFGRLPDSVAFGTPTLGWGW